MKIYQIKLAISLKLILYIYKLLYHIKCKFKGLLETLFTTFYNIICYMSMDIFILDIQNKLHVLKSLCCKI